MNLEFFYYPPFHWGFSIEQKGDTPALIEQVHGNDLMNISSNELWMESMGTPSPADGVLTVLNDKPIYVFSADCIPVLFFSEDPTEPIAAVHAGWRGVKKGIIEKTVKSYKKVELLHAVIGPSIGTCCFRVREDFLSDWKEAQIDTSPFLKGSSTDCRFDLIKYVLTRCLAPLSPSKIHLESYRCTVCSLPRLPSFRRNKTANPRIRSWIVKQSQTSTS